MSSIQNSDAPQQPEAAARTRGTRMPRRQRRVQLMTAALEVFVEHGYHSAAMDEIAERAGVSKPVLYQHFPGKLELYLALLDYSCDTVISNIREALDSTQDNKERVAAAIAAFYSYVAGETRAFRLVFESDLISEPVVRERVDRVTTECSNMVAEVIREDTDLPPAAARLLAVSLVGMAQVSSRFWLSEDDVNGPISQTDAAALVAGLAWRGISGYPLEHGEHTGS